MSLNGSGAESWGRSGGHHRLLQENPPSPQCGAELGSLRLSCGSHGRRIPGGGEDMGCYSDTNLAVSCPLLLFLTMSCFQLSPWFQKRGEIIMLLCLCTGRINPRNIFSKLKEVLGLLSAPPPGIAEPSPFM